ncbi:hypothetical protein IJ670_00040 [bacterium]|nr:hypothetical protein [bacterium]
MTTNAYTKDEILQNLASRGYFIDSFTLDTFFEKWKVEAIFENDQGLEFYDKKALDLVTSNLFNGPVEEENVEPAAEEVVISLKKEVREEEKEEEKHEVKAEVKVEPQPEMQPQKQSETQTQPMPVDSQILSQEKSEQNVQKEENQEPELEIETPVQEKPKGVTHTEVIKNDDFEDIELTTIGLDDEPLNIFPEEGDPELDELSKLSYEATYETNLKNDKQTSPELFEMPSFDDDIKDIANQAIEKPKEEFKIPDKKEDKKEEIIEPKIEFETIKPSKPLEEEFDFMSEKLKNKEDEKAEEKLEEPLEEKPEEIIRERIKEKIKEKFEEPVEKKAFQSQNVNIEIDENPEFEKTSLYEREVMEEDGESEKISPIVPNSGEFKLDISQRTVNIMAKVLAGKVANHVNLILKQQGEYIQKIEGLKQQNLALEEKNKELEAKYQELEGQNKKFKTLINELNKQLKCYVPSVLGLFKKIEPKK